MDRRLGVAAAIIDGTRVPGDVIVSAGVVSATGVSPAGRHGLAVPGLVDLQVNGYAGIDLAGASPDEVDAVRRALAADGVTAFAPTIITGPPDRTVSALRRLSQSRRDRVGARMLPAHLEGPFLSAQRLGTHPPDHRLDPDAAALDRLLAAGPVGLVTLAPELPGALELLDQLAARGVVVLLGHSDATAAQAATAFARGARGVTHLWNAMRPLHHREPGLIGAAFHRREVVVGLVADGHHVAPEIVGMTFRAAAGRTALMTDATAASGMPDGHFVLGDVDVTLRNGAVRNARGDLAGSAATLAGCVRTTVAAGVDEMAAWTAASTVPADLIGRSDLGRISVGGPADVIVVDDQLEVQTVLVAGVEVRGQ